MEPLAPLPDPGVIVPPPLAVRLLIFIEVFPKEPGLEPIVLSITTDAGIKTDLLIAVKPSEAERLALAPKLVELPTLKEVRLPTVNDRFSVDLPDVADGASTVGLPVGEITDWVEAGAVTWANTDALPTSARAVELVSAKKRFIKAKTPFIV